MPLAVILEMLLRDKKINEFYRIRSYLQGDFVGKLRQFFFFKSTTPYIKNDTRQLFVKFLIHV